MSTTKGNITETLKSGELDEISRVYPRRIPVVVECSEDCKFKLDKDRFLVPRDMTFGQFFFIIRKRMKIPPHEAIFCMIQDELPSTNELFSALSHRYKEKDGVLHITLSTEDTFG